jgi:hypothetical protein
MDSVDVALRMVLEIIIDDKALNGDVILISGVNPQQAFGQEDRGK